METIVNKRYLVKTDSSDLVKTELIIKEERIIDINSADIIDIDTITTKHRLVETFLSDPADTKAIIHKKPIVETDFSDLVNKKKYNMKERSTGGLLLEEVKTEDSDDVFSDDCSEENNTEVIDMTEIKIEDVDIKPNSIYLERNLLLEEVKIEDYDIFSEDCSDENNTENIDMTKIEIENVDLKPNSIYLERDLLFEEVKNEDSDDLFSEDCRDENNTEDIDTTEIKIDDVDVKTNSIDLERNEEISDQFRCPYCKYKGCFNSRLVNHMKRVHGIRFLSCRHCSYKTSDADCLKKHQVIHGENATFECSKCKKVFRTKWGIESHFLTKHNLSDIVTAKIHSCSICNFKTTLKSNLFLHINTKHSRLKKYQCNYCLHTFGHKGDLRRHISSVHLNLRPYICRGCKKTFGQKKTLNRHILSHHPTNEGLMKTVTCKVHNCDYCSYKSANIVKVTKHMETHSEPLKPYICTGCKETFIKRTNLDHHIVTHHPKDEGLMKTVTCKIHNCDYCSYKSSNIKIMTKHMAAHNEPLKSYICTGCKKTYRQKKSLNHHIVSQHPTNEGLMKTVTCTVHKCEYCSYKSPNITNVTKHMEAHSGPLKPYICTGCKKTFIIKTNLENHIVRHHSKDEGLMKTVTCKVHNCDYCSYKSSNITIMMKHMAVHNEPLKQYICTECKKTFRHKKSLHHHIVSQHPTNEGLMKTVTCKIHNCYHCSYKSSNITSMRKHRETHNKPLKP